MEQQRVVLITGATGGLGGSVVRAFAAEGARLVLTARKLPDLEAVAREQRLDPATTLLAPADVTVPADVAGLVEAIYARFDTLDVVAHLTGGFKAGRSVAATDDATWRFMLDLNLSAAFVVARAVVPDMIERGSGKLVFVGSKSGSHPMSNLAAYGVSKGGLEIFVRELAEETRQRGVNVNAVAPSIIDTPPNRQAMPNADFDTWVQPDSLADVIHFLTTPAARDIHGAVVPVYGRA